MARINIAIDVNEGMGELETLKQELKKRLNNEDINYVTIVEDEHEQLILSFSPMMYTSQIDLLESFQKEVLDPLFNKR
ncbi:hypothetical protein [Cytobacillus sp. IB215665]|uniref:hypothetical protein n=1 Tax=Cytobacillus sp. IB215665 TaxID=3097357 RepID=UPI002A0C1320|nr:hypothetical protein [Cytobacillus sp. IB215665]MDX8365720.1 hypothetical protein [Cytobacillus sp. IB215665]